MKKLSPCLMPLLLLLLALTAAPAAPARASEPAAEIGAAMDTLQEAAGRATEYAFTGNTEARDAYVEMMRRVDQAIEVYANQGDSRTAALLRARRDKVDKAAVVMFEGYTTNSADLGLQVKAFQQAADDLDGVMQEIVDGQAAELSGAGISPEAQALVDMLIRYQAALRMAGMSGVAYAAGGPEQYRQAYEKQMANADAMAQDLETAAEKAGLDGPQLARTFEALLAVRQGLQQAAKAAFGPRKAKGQAPQPLLDGFFSADAALLEALGEN